MSQGFDVLNPREESGQLVPIEPLAQRGQVQQRLFEPLGIASPGRLLGQPTQGAPQSGSEPLLLPQQTCQNQRRVKGLAGGGGGREEPGF